ncbi:Hsp70 family protein [Sodalinema gerasimenkoae]|uniref:Hsp70 family protein n=1 Tax=Sodalinema gerasimenkoae TaxID=2862348 RepID=UPI001356DD14|nr:Hsp70 family protein [Sodalinema gerasimenkoae]
MGNFSRMLTRSWTSLVRKLTRRFRHLLQREKPYPQLRKTCTKLEEQLETSRGQTRVWSMYIKALSLAMRCDCHQLSQVIRQFDCQFQPQQSGSHLIIKRAISQLLDANPQTPPYLDAAWRLAPRHPDSEAVREIQRQICLQLADLGESNLLLQRVMRWHQCNCLAPGELSKIFEVFLRKHSFDKTTPWKAFFEQLSPEELPKLHPIYALLERYQEAADLAEAVENYESAINYLSSLDGETVAQQQLALAQQSQNLDWITQAHNRLGDYYWNTEDFTQAFEQFQHANNREKVSDCQKQLRKFAESIYSRPEIAPGWIQDLRELVETQARTQVEQQDFLPAIELLTGVARAWRERGQTAEAERTEYYLSEAVRTARCAFELELSEAESDEAVLNIRRHWSQLEEAAGNYLEAALHAEQNQDYFTASLLFEKANAFGQALVALESVNPQDVDPRKKAQLLEQGGDFFMAALLYERLGDLDSARTLYEQAGEFLRAAELRERQVGAEERLFDLDFQRLLGKAGRIEHLAELCAAKAAEPHLSNLEKVRLWRRIKELADLEVLGPKWQDCIAAELPQLEKFDQEQFQQQAANWFKAASADVLGAYSDVIGLDLGTSNSVVCLYNKRQETTEVVQKNGGQQFPSVFAIDQLGQELVGLPISTLIHKSPRAIITGAKREMGTQRKFKVGDQIYRPEEISARIINHARELTREYLECKIAQTIVRLASQSLGLAPSMDWVNDAMARYLPTIPLQNFVITVPAYFNEAQKQATKTAGTLAGIHVLRLIHEPTAACLAQRVRSDKAETILVVDLGAGTLDLSIIQVGEGVFEVIEIEGDNSLGSSDLDEIIYTHMTKSLKADFGEDLPRNSQAATRLRQACEELKIELSSQVEWTIDLPALLGNRQIHLSLSRPELEDLARPWLERIETICRRIEQKPTRVLLIGGGGQMPAVHRCLQRVFNQAAHSVYDPLTVVARGAVLQGAILQGDVQEALLIDVVPFSLGIKCRVAPGQFKFDSVIAKHTSIPIDKTRCYTTTEDGQTQVRIEVFQGESPLPQENFKVGEFVLEGIPIAQAGVPKINVTFEIDSDCLLTVTAQDATTGNVNSITIVDSHLLTPAQTESLKKQFWNSQNYQKSLSRLKELIAALQAGLEDHEYADLANLSARFENRLEIYQQERERYVPTPLDNDILFEIYRDRSQLSDRARLNLDQWGTLRRSINGWLEQTQRIDWRSKAIEAQVNQFVEEGERLLPRTQKASRDIIAMASTYRKWLSVLDNLPIDLEGDPESLAQHFLRLQRYAEAQEQFERLTPPQSRRQMELGLEILARSRQREAYLTQLETFGSRLDLHRPDLQNLNQTVRRYRSSVVCIQARLGGQLVSGSGFVIGPHLIATHRYMVMEPHGGGLLPTQGISIIMAQERLTVKSVHLPTSTEDDIVILEVHPSSMTLNPLRLGFSELVEVGDRIFTLGFPALESHEFEDNLYCNLGLINRIRPSEHCSEWILEVSVPSQPGISGAPIFNQWGEVIGMLTLGTIGSQPLGQGGGGSGPSVYALPIQLLRRLVGELR